MVEERFKLSPKDMCQKLGTAASSRCILLEGHNGLCYPPSVRRKRTGEDPPPLVQYKNGPQ